LNWINEFLQLEYKKVEEMCTGAAYVQIMDALLRGKVPLNKVNYNAKLEYENLKNFAILQSVFDKAGIDKRIDVNILVKGKFQDNLEFLQWMKKYFDLNYNGEPYDPVARRSQALKVPYERDKGKSGATPVKGTPSKVTSSGLSQIQKSATGSPKPKTAPNIKASPTPASSAPKVVQKSTPKPATAFVPAPGVKATPTKTGNEQQLQQQIEELKNLVVGLEKERDFYFGKLRQIETICQNDEEAEISKAVFKVLSAAEDEQPAEEESEPLQEDIDQLVDQLDEELLEEDEGQVTETFEDLPDDEMY